MTTGKYCPPCPLASLGAGYMPGPDVGPDYNGVLLLGEALGGEEARVGKPFQGPAGFVLQQLLDRGGMRREEFAIENSLRCRPPGNALNGEWYEHQSLATCRSHYVETLAQLKPKVVVAMGGTALMQALMLPKRPVLDDHLGYIQEGPEGIPVIATWHPAYVMRGKWNLSGIWRWHLRHARELASGQLALPRMPSTVVDPPSSWMEQVVSDIENHPEWDVSYDIETEHSTTRPEDEFDLSHSSYNITRFSFAYRKGEGISLTFDGRYIPFIKRIMASRNRKVVWNGNYDDPRLERNGIPINGERIDLMWAWHDFESDVPKGLGFVVPLGLPDRPRWKHLSSSNPGVYSAVDATNTLDLLEPIVRFLDVDGILPHFNRHIVELTPVLRDMSKAGVPIGEQERIAVSEKLTGLMDVIRADIESCIPSQLWRFHPEKGFVRTPADTSGMVRITVDAVVKCCASCGEEGVTASGHTARKTLPGPTRLERPPNPCYLAEITQEIRPQVRWTRKLPFSPSNKQLLAYAQWMNHRLIVKDGKPTFDDEALGRLIKRNDKDPLYPLVQDWREIEKLQGTNIGVRLPDGKWDGGMPVDLDGRVHTTYNFNPSTSRLGSQGPNLQNIPHRGQYAGDVRSIFVPEPGCVIVEVDYSAIEAVLVGYFANDPVYTRMAKLGVHDFFNAWMLRRDGKISEEVTVDWSDEDLKAFFAILKKRFPDEREVAKRCVHSGNYGISIYELARKFPKEFPTPGHADLALRAYFDLFASIPRWQNRTIEQASRDGQLRTPFGNRHRFWKCYNWTKVFDEETRQTRWEKEWADDAKRALAFVPQSTAAGIIKDAMLDLPWEIRQYLRLQIHDSLLCHFPQREWESLTRQLIQVMSKPVQCLPLDPSWNLGSHLSIGVEAKMSEKDWASVRPVSMV